MNSAGFSPSHNILTGQTERIAAVSPNASVRIAAKVLALLALLIILAGELGFGNNRIITIPLGIVAAAVALLIQIKEPRRFMKKLGWAALALVALQLIFAEANSYLLRPPSVAMSYAFLSQAVFCAAVALAIFSSRTWFRDLMNPMVVRAENTGYIQFLKFASAVVFAQVILGAGVRHSNDTGDVFLPFIIAHIGGAFMVIIVVTFFNLRTWHVYKDVTPLRRAAIGTGSLLGAQIIAGIIAIVANRSRLEVGLPQVQHMIISTIHLTIGTMLLALMFGTMLRAHRILDRTNYSTNPGNGYQPREVQ